MKCPNCGHPDTSVAWSKQRDGRIVRARDCGNCGKRFQTAEALIAEFERAREIRMAYRELGKAIGPEE